MVSIMGMQDAEIMEQKYVSAENGIFDFHKSKGIVL